MYSVTCHASRSPSRLRTPPSRPRSGDGARSPTTAAARTASAARAGRAQIASAPCQPMLRSSGTVRPAASAAPAVRAATYEPVTRPAVRAKRLFTMLGTITLPIAIPIPASTVPAKSAAVEPAPRAATPTDIGIRASSSKRSAPSRLASIGAATRTAPKHRTGAAVRTPAAVADSPSALRISSVIGGTLATAVRRLRPVRTTPAASVAGNLDVLEPDVVLRERRRRPLRRANVGELRQLQLGVELVAALEAVQHRGHEPGEVLGPPDAAQASAE